MTPHDRWMTLFAPRRPDAGLQRYLVLWWALGAVVLGISGWMVWTGVHEGRVTPSWPVILGLVGLGVASHLAPIELSLRGLRLTTSFYEPALMLALLVADGWLATVMLAVGAGCSLAGHRIGLRRVAFNVAVLLVAGGATVAWVGPVTDRAIDPTAPFGVALLVAVGVSAALVNITAMTGLLWLLDREAGQPFRGRGFLVESAVGALLGIAMGVLTAIVAVAAPVALPLVLVPVLMTRRTLTAGIRLMAAERAERTRMERTIAGASEGICLIDPLGRVELLNPAAVRLLRVDAADAVDTPLDDLLPDDDHERLVSAALGSVTPDEPRRLVEMQVAERTLSIEVTALFAGRSCEGAVVLLVDVTRLREEESLRREFVARVSHELRTPLTAIVGFSETLRSRLEQLDEASSRRYLGVIERHGQRLGRLVDDLLWSARLDAGKVPVAPEPVRLDVLMRHLEVGLRPTLPDVTFTWSVGESTVWADPDHVERILANLVANAATYGAAPIEVCAVPAGRTVVLEVSDAGPGVPEPFVPALFTAFEQASVGDRREAQGLGLGLAIVRSLVEENGGEVGYQRRNGRTVFAVELPTATVGTRDPLVVTR